MIWSWVKVRNPRSQAALRKQGYHDAGRLTWVGYGLPSAVLAVFCYRVFNLWLPLGPAAAALYALQRRPPESQGSLAPDAEVGGDDRHLPIVEDARSARDANG